MLLIAVSSQKGHAEKNTKRIFCYFNFKCCVVFRSFKKLNFHFIFLWNVEEKKTFSLFFSVIFVLWNVCVPVVSRFCQSFSQQFELFFCFLFASLCKMNIYVRKFISACQFLLDNINDLCVCCRMGSLRRFVSESCRKVVDREWKIAPKNFLIWSLDAFSHSSYWILVGFCLITHAFNKTLALTSFWDETLFKKFKFFAKIYESTIEPKKLYSSQYEKAQTRVAILEFLWKNSNLIGKRFFWRDLQTGNYLTMKSN